MTIHNIFQSLPARFKSEKAGNYQTVFHFHFSNEIFYTVNIQNATCEVLEGLHENPLCTIKTDKQTYIDIETGKRNPQEVIMSGDLKIDNLMEMLNFSKLFRKLEIPQTENQTLKGTSSRKPASGPLQGLKILDLTRLLPGPLGTMMLADMGAEVIKVEAPNFHDYVRDFPPFIQGEAFGYLAFNRSKRSLSLDYSNPEGKAVFLELVKQADVLMEQFRPGVMAKMGLGYEDLKKVNEKLIYVSITGYGQTGPYRDLAGHDLNYITLAGLAGGNANTAPQNPMNQMADIAGGSYMAMIGCLSALYSRSITGKGQWVDVSMMDGVMSLAANPLLLHWATDKNLAREEFMLSGGLVNYGIYPCKNKKYIALGTLEAKFWEKFCDIVQKPTWKNRIIAKDADELAFFKQELEDLFMSEEQAYWIDLGLKHDLLLNAVYEANEVANDPHIQARKMVIEMEHPKAGKIKNIGVPLKFSDTQATPAWTAPLLGEDSLAILQEANIPIQTIQDLANKGILKCEGNEGMNN